MSKLSWAPACIDFCRLLRKISFTVSLFLEVDEVDHHPDLVSSMAQFVIIIFLWHFLFSCAFGVAWTPCWALHHPWTPTLIPRPLFHTLTIGSISPQRKKNCCAQNVKKNCYLLKFFSLKFVLKYNFYRNLKICIDLSDAV
jgi:hypothetical protein